MAEAKQNESWNHTASLMHINAVPHMKKNDAKRTDVSDFHPFYEKSEKGSVDACRAFMKG